MKSKKWRVAAVTATVVLIGAVLFLTNAFTGNPISAAIADRYIDRYIEEKYGFLPELDYKETNASYNFKLGKYGKYIQSKSSQDTGFWAGYHDGACMDEYESYVEGRFNTWNRLNREFDKRIQAIIAEQFPYETDMVLGGLGGNAGDMKDSLQVDMELDIHNLPLPGTLTAYILTDEVNKVFLSHRILELTGIMKKNQIQIDYYSVIVEEPRDEEGRWGAAIHTYEIPYSDIEGKTAEELVPVIEAQIERQEAEDAKKTGRKLFYTQNDSCLHALNKWKRDSADKGW